MELTDIDKWKRNLLLGFTGMLLCGAGDVLLGWIGNSGVSFFGGLANTDMVNTPMLQFEISFLFGMIATPLLWIAGSTVNTFLKEILQEKRSGLLKLYSVGMKMLVGSIFCAHSVCCMAMMCIRSGLKAGLTAAVLEASFYEAVYIPFMLTNIWIILGELLISIAYIYLVCKKIIALPGILLLLNPACLYIIFKAAGSLLTAVTGNSVFAHLAGGGGSWGVGLMFLAIKKGLDSYE